MTSRTQLDSAFVPTSRTAATRRVRLDTSRTLGAHIHGIRTGAAPASLEVHVDVSSKPDPDVDTDADWILDKVALGNLAAAAFTEQELVPTDPMPRWVRIRVVHTGADATYEVHVAGKYDA